MLSTSPEIAPRKISLEEYFAPFRANIIGIDTQIPNSFRESKPLIYADWTASGRGYWPIEQRILNNILPFMANTHTEDNFVGSFISHQYTLARQKILQHVNAGEDDVLISYGSGMTDVLNKFQRILGLRIPERFVNQVSIEDTDRPVVFVTHMEHHSNHTSWLETICEVVVVPPDELNMVSIENFKREIERYQDRKIKIAAITACSNVTGIETPYHEIARLTHQYGGFCFVDFACSAPYVHIDMHPDNLSYLDAIYFSPHKFLGGPGSSGILIFDQTLYDHKVPDVVGGGTVDWTNPWGGRKYVSDVNHREDGGTPAILQTIRAALCIELKEAMDPGRMMRRKQELMDLLWEGLADTPGIGILMEDHRDRQGIISFNLEKMPHNEAVRQLNHHGIQVRGGCSCAGTYGHYLLGIGAKLSKEITDLIDKGDVSRKPGWVRLSIHPTTTNEEMIFIIRTIMSIGSISK